MSETSPPPASGLDRALGRRDLTAFAINRVIGAGIFGLPAVLYVATGPASAIAMLLAALAVAIITLCFAEVGSRYSQTGGPYLYAYDSFGPATGFVIGWLLWVTQLGGFAAVTNLLVNYAGWFVPGVTTGLWRAVIITGVVVLLATINILGVRRAAIVNNVLTLAKLAPLAVFVVVGLFYLDLDLFSATLASTTSLPGAATGPTIAAIAGTVFLAIYAYSGFETLGVPSGEVHEPERTIPFALLAGLAVVAIVYVGVQVVSVGTLPDLGSSTRPLADAAERFLGRGGAAFMAVGALLSTLGVSHAIVLAAGRMPFAMSERGQLPKKIAEVHPVYHTPWIGLIVSAVGMWVFTMLTTFTSALTVTVGLRILIYIVTSAAVPILRRRSPGTPAPFHLKGGPFIPAVSVLMCLGLLAVRPATELLQLAIFVALGLTLWLPTQRKAPR